MSVKTFNHLVQVNGDLSWLGGFVGSNHKQQHKGLGKEGRWQKQRGGFDEAKVRAGIR